MPVVVDGRAGILRCLRGQGEKRRVTVGVSELGCAMENHVLDAQEGETGGRTEDTLSWPDWFRLVVAALGDCAHVRRSIFRLCWNEIMPEETLGLKIHNLVRLLTIRTISSLPIDTSPSTLLFLHCQSLKIMPLFKPQPEQAEELA
jgi:hypothetical protein